MRLVSTDGTVETVSLSCTDGRDGYWLRVNRHGFHWRDVRTVVELHQLGIDLADFYETELAA